MKSLKYNPNQLSAKEMINLSIRLRCQIELPYTDYKYLSLVPYAKGLELDAKKGTLLWGTRGGFLWEVFLKGKNITKRKNVYFSTRMQG